ncbi:unnamed protein product, partial [Staurois parvus]
MMSGSDILFTTIHVITDWPWIGGHDRSAACSQGACIIGTSDTAGTGSWCRTLPGSTHTHSLKMQAPFM